MLPITIVPQKREFGCAKAVIKTIIKTKYGLEVAIKDPLLYIKSLGSLSFLAMANAALKENKLPGCFVKKTNVTFAEIQQWLAQERLMVVLFISNENYPHYAVLAGSEGEEIIVANTHGAIFERFAVVEFIERFYLNPRYVNNIEWMRGEKHPHMDRIVRWGIKLGKALGFVKSGTLYMYQEQWASSLVRCFFLCVDNFTQIHIFKKIHNL